MTVSRVSTWALPPPLPLTFHDCYPLVRSARTVLCKCLPRTGSSPSLAGVHPGTAGAELGDSDTTLPPSYFGHGHGHCYVKNFQWPSNAYLLATA